MNIYVGNQLYERVALGGRQTITITQPDGRINRVVVTEEGAYMDYSTCGNQDCIHQGAVTRQNMESRPLQNWIICLPNQVTVELAAQ